MRRRRPWVLVTSGLLAIVAGVSCYFLLPPEKALAYGGPPRSLEELLTTSSHVLVGKVEAVSTYSFDAGAYLRRLHGFVIAGSFVVLMGLARRWPRGNRRRVACILLVLTVLSCSHSIRKPDGLRRLDEWIVQLPCAFVSVEQAVRGPLQGIRQLEIRFRDRSACDASSFRAGRSYLLFLRQADDAFRLSRHHWAQLEIQDGAVRATWESEDRKVIDLHTLLERIAAITDAQEPSHEKHPG